MKVVNGGRAVGAWVAFDGRSRRESKVLHIPTIAQSKTRLTGNTIISIHQPHLYILLSAFAFALPPASVCPPSNSSTFPVICALATLLKNSTNPPKSLGRPIRPVGCPLTSVSLNLLSPNAVILEGNTPGQMTLTMMFCGASLLAWILVRCMTAALLGP